MPAHRELAAWLDAPFSWEAEFQAGPGDLTRLILDMAVPGEGAAPKPR
jgi:hypothetical protein